MPEILSTLRPEPDPKSQAQLITLVSIHHSTYNQPKTVLNSGHSCIEAFSTAKLLQYIQVRIIVLSIYNDTVTPGMKINSLYYFMVCFTPQYTLL